MGYKGYLRSVSAEINRREREARKRQRELARRQKQLEKMEALERAKFEVEQFDNYLDIITSVHKECGERWDWKAIDKRPEPRKPHPESYKRRGVKAQVALETYKPSRSDRLLRRVDSKKDELASGAKVAKAKDEKEFQAALAQYYDDHRQWKELIKLSKGILSGDPTAYDFAIELLDPFSEISGLGSSITFNSDDGKLMEASLKVNNEKIIPKEQKTLLKSGKVSIKNMTKTRYYELYQDHVCGCAIRVARELYALLPLEMVIFSATSDVLNTSTGHLEEQPILSVAMPRDTIDGFNFSTLDPSDSMQNFVFLMKFTKTKGFKPVAKILPAEFVS